MEGLMAFPSQGVHDFPTFLCQAVPALVKERKWTQENGQNRPSLIRKCPSFCGNLFSFFCPIPMIVSASLNPEKKAYIA